jgi:PAS domain S-box-containing protein
MSQHQGRSDPTSAAARLAASEAWLFRAVFEQAAIGMCCCDLEGRFLLANRRFCAMTGYDEAELVGRTFIDITHPDDLPSNLRLVEELRSERRETVSMEKRYRRKSGETVWSHTSLSLARVPGERPRYVIVTAEDITARKAVEQRLAANEARLGSVQRIAGVGSWDLDLATRRVTLDEIGMQIYGLEPDSFDGSYEAFINLVDPRDRERIRSADLCAIENGLPAQNEYRVMDRHGRPRIVVERSGPGFDAQGRRVSLRCAVLDVTELHRIEAALRERESLLRQGAALARFGSWVWDTTTDRCLYCSDELAALFEMTPQEYMQERGSSRQLREAAPLEDRATFDMIAAMAVGQTYDVEFRNRTKGGALRHFREVGRIYRDEVTGHVHSLGVTQDITAAKQTELDLRRALNDTEAANRAKSQFLATMSHELRTPLNAIIGFSDMLLTLGGRLTPEKQRDYYQSIHESGRHLLEVINDILDLARIEAGRVETSHEAVDLRAVVRECAGYLEGLAGERQVSIELDIDCVPPTSDRRLVKQIILNLMANAVKFNRTGGKVDVKARRNGPNAVITVSDTGIGMTAAEIKRARQPFVQLEPAYHRSQEGSGLGLTLVDRFARLLGGHLEIRSEKGVGTAMIVTLPLGSPE